MSQLKESSNAAGPLPGRRHYLRLIVHLVIRDFYIRHTGSLLGVAWAILVPLVQLVALIFTFGKVVPIAIDDYPAFVYVALLPWSWFGNCVSTAGLIFFSHRDLVRRPHFPPGILPIVNTMSHFTTLLFSLPLLLGILFWYGRGLTMATLLLPILFVVQATILTGITYLLATWNVFYRDVSQLANVVLSFLFFLTPIFYRPAVDSDYALIFQVNPMSNLIACYRAVLFEGSFPPASPLIISVVSSIFSLALGYSIFRAWMPDVVDAV